MLRMINDVDGLKHLAAAISTFSPLHADLQNVWDEPCVAQYLDGTAHSNPFGAHLVRAVARQSTLGLSRACSATARSG